MPLGFCKPDSVHPCGLCGHFSRVHGDVLCRGAECDYYPGDFRRAGDPPPVCLASRGAYRAAVVTNERGGLLPHHFTLTLTGGIISVVLSVTMA